MEKFKRENSQKIQNFIQKAHTLPLNYLPIGLQKILESHIRCSLQMEFCLIMSLQEERETFVTRKITLGLSRVIYGLEKCLYLGNLYSLRDWGHAKDYVEMCWKVLQHKNPDDFVIATEKQYSVKFFVEQCFKYLRIKIKWSGKKYK